MSGSGPPYSQSNPYTQPAPYNPYSQSGYTQAPGDIPMTASYPNASYPSAAYPSAPVFSSGAGSDPPPYPGTTDYALDYKGYPSNASTGPSGDQPYPPNQPPYPSGVPGYFPEGGVFMPPRPMHPPGNPYQRTVPEDQQHIITRNSGQDGWAGSSFSEKKIRHVFIRKVYLILMAQLLVTVAFIAVFLFCPTIRRWVHENSWFYHCSYAVFLVTYIVLICCDGLRRRWPANFIALSIFTLAMSYMTGTISSVYETDIVLIAIAITAGVCLAISIFAIQTKIDFTLCSGLIFVLSMVLLLFGIACIITFVVSGPNYILSCVYGGVAALVFSVFLIFDTQMVVGGTHRRYQLSPEEHIYGAMQLYVDVVNLFIILLGLVGKRN